MAGTLGSELDEALRSEHGALVAYRRLALLVRDPELARVLATFVEDELRQIAELTATIEALGLRPVRASLRRRLLAEVLAFSVRVFGPRFALRVCREAEETRARWYAHLGGFLRDMGERRFDASFQRMSLLKQHHALSLGAWVHDD